MQGAIQRHYYDLQGAGVVISAGKIKMRLEQVRDVFDKPLTQSAKSRKKIAQAKEIAQLAQQLGVAL